MVKRMEFHDAALTATSGAGSCESCQWINGAIDQSDIELECISWGSFIWFAGFD
jgi:hypothetical protein